MTFTLNRQKIGCVIENFLCPVIKFKTKEGCFMNDQRHVFETVNCYIVCTTSSNMNVEYHVFQKKIINSDHTKRTQMLIFVIIFRKRMFFKLNKYCEMCVSYKHCILKHVHLYVIGLISFSDDLSILLMKPLDSDVKVQKVNCAS